jgi:hypothetical protein
MSRSQLDLMISWGNQSSRLRSKGSFAFKSPVFRLLAHVIICRNFLRELYLISAETYMDFAEGETSWVPGMMEPYNSQRPCVWLDSKLGILLLCNVCEYHLLNLSSGCCRTCQHGGGGIGYWGLTIVWTSLSSLLILSSIFGCCAEAEPGSSTARNEHQKNHEVQPSEMQLLRITSASIVICIIKLIKESCRLAYQLCQRLSLLCP